MRSEETRSTANVRSLPPRGRLGGGGEFQATSSASTARFAAGQGAASSSVERHSRGPSGRRETVASSSASLFALALLFASLAILPGCTNPRGSLTTTDRPLDVAIVGEGFFIVQTPSGGYLFTRRGDFFLAGDNRLVNGDGYALAPKIDLPAGVKDVSIAPDGKIIATRVGENTGDALGYVKLAKFVNPLRLKQDGVYFTPSDGSGEPTTHRPGTEGVGTLRTAVLEK